MVKLFKEEKLLYKVITIGVLGIILWFLWNVADKVITGLYYPQEILEPANVALTNLFRAGKSPYTLSALEWEVPGINYDYPFLTGLVAAGISAITGLETYVSHYLLSYLCIIFSGILGYCVIRKYAITTVAPVLGAFLFMLCHWRFGFVSAAPDDFGEFLFLLTLTLAVMPKIKNKPLWCAIGVTLCFYTKQYFVFVAFGIFVYFLFYSRKTAWKFFLYTFVINLAVGAVITIFWPLYWTYSIFFCYVGCFSGEGFGISYLLGQMKYLAAIFIGLFAVLVVALVRVIKRIKSSGSKLSKLMPTENDALSLFVIEIPVMFLPLIFFGRNDGAFLSYFLQLWMPSVVIVALVAFERMKPEMKEWIFGLIYVGVVVFTVYFGIGKLPMHKLSEEEKAAWQKAYAIIDEYSNQGDIVYSRAMALRSFEREGGGCLCGHDGEVTLETIDKWEKSPVFKNVFPYAGEIIRKNDLYRKKLMVLAALHQNSLVTFETDGYSMMFSKDIVEGWSYIFVDEIVLQLGNMPYTVEFYRSNPNAIIPDDWEENVKELEVDVDIHIEK